VDGNREAETGPVGEQVAILQTLRKTGSARDCTSHTNGSLAGRHIGCRSKLTCSDSLQSVTVDERLSFRGLLYCLVTLAQLC
jgi:hypothetical protein